MLSIPLSCHYNDVLAPVAQWIERSPPKCWAPDGESICVNSVKFGEPCFACVQSGNTEPSFKQRFEEGVETRRR